MLPCKAHTAASSTRIVLAYIKHEVPIAHIWLIRWWHSWIGHCNLALGLHRNAQCIQFDKDRQGVGVHRFSPALQLVSVTLYVHAIVPCTGTGAKVRQCWGGWHAGLVLSFGADAATKLGRLTPGTRDAAQMAFLRANSSYSPYTKCPAAIVLVSRIGLHCGSIVESAAHSPTYQPLQAALSVAMLDGLTDFSEVSLYICSQDLLTEISRHTDQTNTGICVYITPTVRGSSLA